MGLVACAQPASGMVQSDKPRVTTPNVPETDLKVLVDGNNEFAFNLYPVNFILACL